MHEEYLSSIQEPSDIMTNTVTLILNNIVMQWIQGQLLLREVGLWTEHFDKIPGEFVKNIWQISNASQKRYLQQNSATYINVFNLRIKSV